jgi:hypothetical protein
MVRRRPTEVRPRWDVSIASAAKAPLVAIARAAGRGKEVPGGSRTPLLDRAIPSESLVVGPGISHAVLRLRRKSGMVHLRPDAARRDV